MKKLAIFLLFTILTVCGCSSDSDSTPSSRPLLKKAVQLGSSDPLTIDYTYNGSKLHTMKVVNGPLYIYEYAGDLIIKMSVYMYTPSEKTAQVTYTYDNQQHLIGQLESDFFNDTATRLTYSNSNGQTIAFNEFNGDLVNQNNLTHTGFIYLNENGETVKKETYTSEVLNSTSLFTYDTKNSCLKNITGFRNIFADLYIGKVNNILTCQEFNASDVMTYSYVNQYTYNEGNYPTSVTASVNSQSPKTTQWTY